MANKDIGQKAKERWANMSEEERNKEIEQRGRTLRKHKFEEREMSKKLIEGLKITMNFPDKDTGKIEKRTIGDRGTELLLRDLINEDLSPNERINLHTYIRDTTEGRPTTKVDLKANVTTTVEELLKQVQGETKY
jgi:hypothetical protein